MLTKLPIVARVAAVVKVSLHLNQFDSLIIDSLIGGYGGGGGGGYQQGGGYNQGGYGKFLDPEFSANSDTYFF